jgi:hypothetical protein
MKMPRRLTVFDEMVTDPAVKAPLMRTTDPIVIGMGLGESISSGTRRSQVLADFNNTWMHSMKGQSWIQACANFSSDMQYGFSLSEIEMMTATKGDYKGSKVPKQFAPRSQKSIYAWVWDNNFSHVIGYVQKPKTTRWENLPDGFGSYYGNASDLSKLSSQLRDWKFPIISIEESVHFTFGSINNNPEGKSPLEACYAPWKSKNIIEQYQVIGISRDFGGVPILRLTPDLINKANDPENKFPEEKRIYEEYKRQMASMHAGQQAYMILSSQLNQDSNSLYEFDFKLLGVEGGGKQFDISEIVKAKNTAIANAFLAGHLLLGQQGNTSSYGASESQSANNSLLVKRALIEKAEYLRYTLFPAIYDANGIYYTQKDLPIFKFEDPDKPTWEDLGKLLQRMKSVGALTPEATEYAYRLCGFPVEGIDDLDFTAGDTSKAGMSKGTSGTGTSQSGGANSSTNMENKSAEKIQNWTVDNWKDGQGALLNENGDFIRIVEID